MIILLQNFWKIPKFPVLSVFSLAVHHYLFPTAARSLYYEIFRIKLITGRFVVSNTIFFYLWIYGVLSFVFTVMYIKTEPATSWNRLLPSFSFNGV